MKKPRVLIVEDESSIAELIAVNLRHNGFDPIWSEDGVSAQREIDTLAPDLILLDWMLPGQSGLQLARQWRKDPRTKIMPIFSITGALACALAFTSMFSSAVKPHSPISVLVAATSFSRSSVLKSGPAGEHTVFGRSG